jgi:hypothetical protein
MPVKLAASVLFHLPTASWLRGVRSKDAYHTSLIVGDVEYFFDGEGVQKFRCRDGRDPPSHAVLQSQTIIIDMGVTTVHPDFMYRVLRQMFQQGTYDLIRKNCNSFCDCALFYLLSERLDPRFRELERTAKWGQKNFRLMDALRATGFRYQQNPRAADFKCDEAVRCLAKRRTVSFTRAKA